MTTPNVQTPQGAPGAQRPKPLRIVRGPDGKPRVVRRGMAAFAALQANIPKVLRIGVIQGARIVEERIVRKRETVFVGSNEKNHFVVPAQSEPSKHPLFELRAGDKGEQYFLTFLDNMSGRVAFPADQGGVVDFAALKASNRAVRTPKGWQVALTDQCRGKVVVGDTTMLFQFVVPPPIQPRPQLPASVKGGWISRMELGMMVCMGVSVVLHTGIMVATMVPEWPKPTLDEILSSEWAQMPLPVPEEAKMPEDDKVQDEKVDKTGTDGQATAEGDQAATADVAATQAEAPKPGAQHQGPAQPSVMVGNQHVSQNAYNAMQAKIQNSISMENILGGGSSGPIGIASAFGGSASTTGNLQQALEGTVGTTEGGAGGSYTTSQGNLSAGAVVGQVGQGDGTSNVQALVPTHDDATKVEPQKIITGRVNVAKGTKAGGTGMMNRDVFMGAFQRKIRGIEQCYNNALPRDPTLAGDLTFLITINMQGGVNVTVESDSPSLRAADVTDCIERKLSSMNFAASPPQGGDFRVRQSFSFIPP